MTGRQIRFAGAVARCGSLAAARREEPFSDSWLWFLMRDERFCEHLRFIGVDEATIESCVRESEAFVRKKSGGVTCGSGASVAKSGAEARGSGASVAKSGAKKSGSGANATDLDINARKSGTNAADLRAKMHGSGDETAKLDAKMHGSGVNAMNSSVNTCESGGGVTDLYKKKCKSGVDAALSWADTCESGVEVADLSAETCENGDGVVTDGAATVNGGVSGSGGTSGDGDDLSGSPGGEASVNRDVFGYGGTSGGGDDLSGSPGGRVSVNRDVSGCGEATVNGVVSGSGEASGGGGDPGGLPSGGASVNRDVFGRGEATVNGIVSGKGEASGCGGDPGGLPGGGASGDGDNPGRLPGGGTSGDGDDPGGATEGGPPGGDAERELLSEIRGLRAAAMRDKSLKLADRLGAASALERSLLEGSSVAAEERVRFRLPADAIGRAFVDINRKIVPNVSYIFTGGRCSGKSSFIALKIIEIMLGEPTIHACAVRKLATTLRDSVYAQFEWAIRELGLSDKFRFKYSPLEIVYIPTGQTIFFRGVDDAAKLKSTRPPFGTIGILWREEADQLSGPDEARGIAQSVLRGGGVAYDFSSYNPPRSKKHWINALPDGGAVRHHSTYLELPEEWVGRKFLDDAEHLRVSDPAAYEHEYLGVPNGVGGAVFEKLEVRRISDGEIDAFDRIYQGIDFGWYPDPLAFLRLHYDAARERIYLIDELYGNKIQNSEAADFIISRGYDDERIVCDSAEPRSIAELRRFGVPAVGAVKGAGSVAFGFRWLAARTIVVDPERTPKAYAELAAYELSPEGDFPDRDDHAISALRYATERIRA